MKLSENDETAAIVSFSFCQTDRNERLTSVHGLAKIMRADAIVLKLN